MNRYQKLIIIGAPRSGTNMLRDVLTRLPGYRTWPCDEINPIWLHGHLGQPCADALRPEQANDELRRFVRKQFDRIASTGHTHSVVEKTCANSLRVAYVQQLLPEARLVFIMRHGADAVASAIQRWSSPFELAYTLRKLRFVPITDLPIYGWRFLRNRLRQALDREHRMQAWGPMTAEVAQAAREGDIVRAAALQWRDCVELSMQQLPNDAIRVRYEDLVREPQAGLQSLLGELDDSRHDPAQRQQAARLIRGDLAGRGEQRLASIGALKNVAAIINPSLERLGYNRIDG